MRICQQSAIVPGSLCYYISFHMEVTPFVLTKNMRMKLSSVCFSPGADNALVTQHPLFSLREHFNLCFFISLGAGLLTCSVHYWFREGKPLMHSRLLRQVSSLPLESWSLMHTPDHIGPSNSQLRVCGCFCTNKEVTARISLGVTSVQLLGRHHHHHHRRHNFNQVCLFFFFKWQ